MNMNRALMGCVGVVYLSISLFACTNLPSQASIEGDAPGTGPQTQTASCGALVELDLDLSGTGSVSILVTDGSGRKVFDNDSPITGNLNTTDNVTGIAGTWTLTVDPTDFDGNFNVELSCP
jgi:hypothetical protein